MYLAHARAEEEKKAPEEVTLFLIQKKRKNGVPGVPCRGRREWDRGAPALDVLEKQQPTPCDSHQKFHGVGWMDFSNPFRGLMDMTGTPRLPAHVSLLVGAPKKPKATQLAPSGECH